MHISKKNTLVGSVATLGFRILFPTIVEYSTVDCTVLVPYGNYDSCLCLTDLRPPRCAVVAELISPVSD